MEQWEYLAKCLDMVQGSLKPKPTDEAGAFNTEADELTEADVRKESMKEIAVFKKGT